PTLCCSFCSASWECESAAAPTRSCATRWPRRYSACRASGGLLRGLVRVFELLQRVKASFDAAPLPSLHAYAGLLGPEAGPRRSYPVAGRAELLPPLGVLDTFVERHRGHARGRAHLEAIVVAVHRAFDLDAARL